MTLLPLFSREDVYIIIAYHYKGKVLSLEEGR
jgi:hypothetical protein